MPIFYTGIGEDIATLRGFPGRVCMLPPACVQLVVLNSASPSSDFVVTRMHPSLALTCTYVPRLSFVLLIVDARHFGPHFQPW